MMHSQSPPRWLIGLVFTALPCCLCADDRHAADLLPQTTAIYLEIDGAKEVLEHPFVRDVLESKTFKAAMRQPEIVKMRGGLTLAEFALGDTLPNLITKVGAKGISLAVDAETEGIVLLAHAADEKQLSAVMDKLLTMAQEQAKKNGQSDSIKTKEYRGAFAYQVDKALIARFGEWLIVTNKSELGKSIVDRMVDKSADHLNSNERYKQAIGAKSANQASENDRVAWAFVDVQFIRDSGKAADLFSGKSKDPGGELILGGLMGILHNTPFATGSLMLQGKEARLSLEVPHDVSWIGEEREFFFGPKGQGRALPLLDAPNTVASLSAYRDISSMWLRAGDLFNQEVNDQLSQAESNLATLFSGKDFAEDILGAIQPEIRVIATKQDFADGAPTPSIKLPQFALVAQLRNPETMQRELRRIFQSLVGFLNIVGAMNGQPQLELDSEKMDGVSLTMATYSPDADEKNLAELPIQFNFSPCIVFKDKNVILASTIDLAKKLIATSSETTSDPANSTSGQEDSAKSNTLLEIEASVLSEILAANKKQIIANNMLEKGQSAEQAGQEFTVLLTIVDFFERARLDFHATDRAVLDVSLFVK
jgi:hypothetical protein